MARHLLTVWNPSYAESVMDQHLAVLLGLAERRGDHTAEGDECHVWWAKIRSPNRQQPLPHIAEILAIQEQIDRDEETHLYLTDYRSLYVAHLDEITDENVLEDTPGEIAHMPPYYAEHTADFWFKLLDVRLLIADDTVATIEELKKLRNVRYHDKPISLYGGIVELPIIVTREHEVSWFGDDEALTGGRLWAERDAEMRGETERMARELRDNLIGRKLWTVLEPATKNFLASAEAVFRSRRDDPRFDFSGPAIEYAKAVETELNALLFPLLRKALKKAPPAEREVTIDGRKLDLGGEVGHQGLGVLRNLLSRTEVVRGCVRKSLPLDESWLLNDLPSRLAGLLGLRNPAAHSERASRHMVSDIRDETLGIGSTGLITKLAASKERLQ